MLDVHEFHCLLAQVQSPGSADGSFNASGSVIVSGKHAIKKVFGFFTTWWRRSPRKSYSPTMAAAKSVRYSSLIVPNLLIL